MAYNIVRMDAKCPVCGVTSFMEIQFKYAFVRGLEYEVGDALVWPDDEIDTPKPKRIRIEGTSGRCPHCKTDYFQFDLVLENDRFKEARPISEEVRLAQRKAVVDED